MRRGRGDTQLLRSRHVRSGVAFPPCGPQVQRLSVVPSVDAHLRLSVHWVLLWRMPPVWVGSFSCPDTTTAIQATPWALHQLLLLCAVVVEPEGIEGIMGPVLRLANVGAPGCSKGAHRARAHDSIFDGLSPACEVPYNTGGTFAYH